MHDKVSRIVRNVHTGTLHCGYATAIMAHNGQVDRFMGTLRLWKTLLGPLWRDCGDSGLTGILAFETKNRHLVGDSVMPVFGAVMALLNV